MQREPVTSSQISSVGYDIGRQVLEIEFKPLKDQKEGSVYQYANVPPSLHESMMKAPSVGSFFYKNIKPKREAYPFTKIIG